MTYSCAYCGATASTDTGCATCGRDPDPDAAEVARCDAEITRLIAHLATARRAVNDIDERIGHAWERRNAADARVRAAVSTARPRRAALARPLLYPLGLAGTAAAVLPVDLRLRTAVLAATGLAAAFPLRAALRRRPPEPEPRSGSHSSRRRFQRAG